MTSETQRIARNYVVNKASSVGRLQISSFRRRGKYLLVEIDTRELVIHLGMSGRLVIGKRAPSSPHLRATLRLSQQATLSFVDQRKFGTIRLVSRGDYRFLPTLARLGPEPLSSQFRPGDFFAVVRRSRVPIKSLLLGQRVVAGLGNIYTDEALFRAGIHPSTRGLGLAPATRLYAEIRGVLREALAHGGTSFSLHQDGLGDGGDYLRHLQAFGREGRECLRCGNTMVKTRLRGRGTTYCSTCQMR